MALRKERSKKLFHSIGEVSNILRESEATLKHWERQFPHIKPQRTAGGTRQYTEADIESLRAVQRLLRQEGLTTEGAKTALNKRKSSLERREQALTRLRSTLAKLEALRDTLGVVHK